jgi:hypothetical protein
MKKILFLLVTLCIIGCSGKKTSENTFTAVQKMTSPVGMLAADTIIYDVIIRNPNPDDRWTENCLKGLKRTELVNAIFTLIYEEKVIPLDFDTHQPLQVKDIKLLENQKDFSRDKVGKIQFKERWIFDTNKLTFTKQIISMVLGYEVFDDMGELRGYKPAFIVYFNQASE